MADTGILATTQEVQDFVGANASSTSNVEAYINRYIAEVESLINVESEYNWSDNYSGLNNDVKKLLTRAAATKTAMAVIMYDPNRWSLSTVTLKINYLQNEYDECIRLLRETDKAQIFIQEA